MSYPFSRLLSLFFLLLPLGLGCGGASGVSTTDGSGRLVPLDLGGNLVEVEVETAARYLYALNGGSGTVSAYAFPQEEEEHGHGHEHSHRLVPGHLTRAEARPLLFSEHDEEHDHDEQHGGHDHDHHGEDHHEEHDDEHHDHDEGHDHHGEDLELESVPGSPFSLEFVDAIDLVASPASTDLFVLDARGGLHRYRIEPETGALSSLGMQNTRLDQVRRLRLSADGRTLAVLGAQLRLYRIGPESELEERIRLEETDSWNDLYLVSEDRLFAGTNSGLLELTKLPGQLEFQTGQLSPEVRETVVLAPVDEDLLVLERAPGRVLRLVLGAGGPARIAERIELPEGWARGQALAAVDGLEQGRVAVAEGRRVGLFDFHRPTAQAALSTVSLDREAVELVSVFGSEYLLAAHFSGSGLSVLHPEGDSIFVEQREPFGGPNPFRLTQLEALYRTTVRSGL